mgnify:CR=1 FL=1
MAVIKIKKTPRSSYNDRRKPSQLLLDQIGHLEWAVLPAAKRRTLRKTPPVKTEAQAAARVAQLMALLLEAKESAASKPAVQKLPKLPKAKSARRPAAKKAGAAKKIARKKPVARKKTSRKVR